MNDKQYLNKNKLSLKERIYDIGCSIHNILPKFRKNSSLATKGRRKTIFVTLMLVPAAFNFIMFWLVINFNTILLGFKDVNGIFSIVNFQVLFREMTAVDSILRSALVNTLKFFALGTFGILPLSILISYFLHKKILGHSVFRVIFFMPSILSAVVLTMLFKYIIDRGGPVAWLWQTVSGSSAPAFLFDSDYAMPTVMFYMVWTGFSVNMILFQGAMNRVPTEIIEAGRLDGVSMTKELFGIILPLIWPTISTLLLFSFVGLFTASGPILLLTKGLYDTNTISYWIYSQVADQGSFNYSSAVGITFTIIGLPIVLLVKKLLSKVAEDVEY